MRVFSIPAKIVLPDRTVTVYRYHYTIGPGYTLITAYREINGRTVTLYGVAEYKNDKGIAVITYNKVSGYDSSIELEPNVEPEDTARAIVVNVDTTPKVLPNFLDTTCSLVHAANKQAAMEAISHALKYVEAIIRKDANDEDVIYTLRWIAGSRAVSDGYIDSVMVVLNPTKKYNRRRRICLGVLWYDMMERAYYTGERIARIVKDYIREKIPNAEVEFSPYVIRDGLKFILASITYTHLDGLSEGNTITFKVALANGFVDEDGVGILVYGTRADTVTGVCSNGILYIVDGTSLPIENRFAKPLKASRDIAAFLMSPITPATRIEPETVARTVDTGILEIGDLRVYIEGILRSEIANCAVKVRNTGISLSDNLLRIHHVTSMVMNKGDIRTVVEKLMRTLVKRILMWKGTSDNNVGLIVNANGKPVYERNKRARVRIVLDIQPVMSKDLTYFRYDIKFYVKSRRRYTKLYEFKVSQHNRHVTPVIINSILEAVSANEHEALKVAAMIKLKMMQENMRQ